MTTQTAINAIRAQAGLSTQDRLDIVRVLLVGTSADSPESDALLDCCEALQAIIESDALEAADEAYRASPTYRQDMRNEAVARGA